VDHRTDLFSLGVVMYQMASGKLPFAGSSAQETLARILQSPPDALGRLNYELPEEFERIVKKCLEKDRERRYQSARELLVWRQDRRENAHRRQSRGDCRR
jgi:serine/threonine protein kinase